VRDVDIPPHIIPLIEGHLAKHVGSGRDSLIFPADNGGHLQPSTLQRRWYKAREKAGRQDLRWHDLPALRCGAGGGDRRHVVGTDGAPWTFDAAGCAALPAQRMRQGPRDRGAAVQAGRQRGSDAMTEMLVYCDDPSHTAEPVGPIITDPNLVVPDDVFVVGCDGRSGLFSPRARHGAAAALRPLAPGTRVYGRVKRQDGRP
jgi:hypothetical protein